MADSYRRGRSRDTGVGNTGTMGAAALGRTDTPADDFYSSETFDESQFWAARRSTGLGGALGDIGADAGVPRDVDSDPNRMR